MAMLICGWRNRNAPQLRLLRNDAPNVGHFVVLRLQGTHANRDAIGARVEVYPAGPGPSVGGESLRRPLIKTLRAGDGFLSQSSKWLHFGLGDATEIERVVVRWPGGPAEEFRDLASNRHYDLVQGAGLAKLWRRPQPSVLVPSSQSPAKITESARIWLAARPDMPRLDYVRVGRVREAHRGRSLDPSRPRVLP